MKGELFDPGAEEVPPAWDEFTATHRRGAGWDRSALVALAAGTRGPRPWLCLVRDGELPVALFVGRLEGARLGRRVLGGWFACKLWPLASTPGFAFAAGLDAAGRRAAVAAFERALFRRLGPACAGVLYRAVDDASLPAFGSRSRLLLPAPPSLVVENRWGSLQEYFSDMPRHRRHRLRGLLRSLERDPGLRIQIAGNSVLGAEASRLSHLTLRRHWHAWRVSRRRPIPAGWFDHVAGRDGVRFHSYRDPAGRLLAFGLNLDDGAWVRAGIWGSLDPHTEGRKHLYFDYHLRTIAHAIEHGRAGVRLGNGMEEAKRRFGAIPLTTFMLASPR
jgi:hypothetical protein